MAVAVSGNPGPASLGGLGVPQPRGVKRPRDDVEDDDDLWGSGDSFADSFNSAWVSEVLKDVLRPFLRFNDTVLTDLIMRVVSLVIFSYARDPVTKRLNPSLMQQWNDLVGIYIDRNVNGDLQNLVFSRWTVPISFALIRDIVRVKSSFQRKQYLVSVSVDYDDDLNGIDAFENTKIVTTWRINAGTVLDAPVPRLDPFDHIIKAVITQPTDPILDGTNIAWSAITTSDEDKIVVATTVATILRLCVTSVPKFRVVFDATGIIRLYVTEWLLGHDESQIWSLLSLESKDLFNWTPFNFAESNIFKNRLRGQRTIHIPIRCYRRDSLGSMTELPFDQPAKHQKLDVMQNLQAVGSSSTSDAAEARLRNKDANLSRLKAVFD